MRSKRSAAKLAEASEIKSWRKKKGEKIGQTSTICKRRKEKTHKNVVNAWEMHQMYISQINKIKKNYMD